MRDRRGDGAMVNTGQLVMKSGPLYLIETVVLQIKLVLLHNQVCLYFLLMSRAIKMRWPIGKTSQRYTWFINFVTKLGKKRRGQLQTVNCSRKISLPTGIPLNRAADIAFPIHVNNDPILGELLLDEDDFLCASHYEVASRIQRTLIQLGQLGRSFAMKNAFWALKHDGQSA